MPTLLREGGFKFIIYFNDHEPSYVHVRKAEGEIKIDISSMGNVEIIKIVGFKDQEALKAMKLVSKYQTFLLARWEEIHG